MYFFVVVDLQQTNNGKKKNQKTFALIKYFQRNKTKQNKTKQNKTVM